MSVSKNVKEEIIKKAIQKKESTSLLQGIFISAGSLVISGGKLSFVISSELESVIDLVKRELENKYSDIVIDISKVVKNFKNKERYELFVDDNHNERVLKDLGIISYDEDNLLNISDTAGKGYMASSDKMLAFLVGVFLGAGSLSVPCETAEKRKYGYHFEMNLMTKEQVDVISEIFSCFDIFPKVIERNESFVLYVKNSETICDILSLFGANKMVLELESAKVTRDVNNNTNRQINCISANIDKTVNAALEQLKAIEIIQNTIGLENLPDNLNEVALLRIANPESSLNDLLGLMETKISKGALAQRFEKIKKLAKELGENDG